MAEEGPQLTPVGEKSLPAKCKPSTLAYCPTMDLIALATEDEELRIFRLNGQRVFGGSFGGDPYMGEDEEDGEVRALAWKGNGEYRNPFDETRSYILIYVFQVACSLSRVGMDLYVSSARIAGRQCTITTCTRMQTRKPQIQMRSPFQK